MRAIRPLFLAALGVLAVAHGVHGRQQAAPAAAHKAGNGPPDPTKPEEYKDQGPTGARALLTSIPAATFLPRGASFTAQVNVSADAMNIVGDAANEPSIAVDPTAPNRMAIGWRQFDSVQSNFREGGYAYTVDAGRTWTFPGVLEEGVFRSDPVLDFDSQGNFYYYSLDAGLFCQIFRSSDGGRTWSAPVPAFGGDKNWMAVDRTGGAGEGHVYGIWKPGVGCCGNNMFTRSSNAGAMFDPPVPIAANPIRGTVAAGPESVVYVAGQTGSSFRVARSLTARLAGETPTFTSAVPVNLGGTLGGYSGPNPGGILAQAWVACDTSGGAHHGNVYLLCSVHPTPPDPLDVMFSRSTDGGQTWSPPVRINDDAPGADAWQWFGTMSVAPNGRIDVAWNDTRESPGNNGEQDVYCTRIGDYDCNGNGMGDESDLASGAAQDCDMNGIPDSCEIAAGVLADSDGDGIPDTCECAADFNADTVVNSQDFFDYLACFFDTACADADFNSDDLVNSQDLFDFLVAFFAGC